MATSPSTSRSKKARVDPKRTAIRRIDFSRTVKVGLEEGWITEEASFFDYGCGHGDDLRRLEAMGVEASGWDPGHRPDAPKKKADVVNLGFVLNVIEEDKDRRKAIQEAWKLANKVLIVGARLNHDRKRLKGVELEDGLVTRKGTFQKFFDQTELRGLIDQALEGESLAAAPGIFVVFRDEAMRQTFLAKRQRRVAAAPKPRISDILFEEHKPLLEALMSFFTERGRLPGPGELEEAPAIEEAIGTLKQAFAVVRRVTGKEEWAAIAENRRQDLLVYLAIARLSKRPRLGELSHEMQLDIRALFGTHKKACEQADELLFAAGNQEKVHDLTANKPFGKTTPDAFYVHISALSSL
ncbi:MAG: DNA phosphorothioation-associated putative methyltransferase, partial [Planctomycetes bacterium]|nr:DNA phosphorothioation-associated putative methyltransferase [Planctomycetota bacterium]